MDRSLTVEEQKTPWWLWPNLLSLDAPVVALAWAWVFGKAWGVVSLPSTVLVTLAVAVWMIYVLDRILDARRADDVRSLQRRHRFHQKHQKLLIVGVCLGFAWCAYAALFLLAQTVLLYGVFVAVCAVLYFGFVLRLPRVGDFNLKKNLIAGLTFSYGVAAGIHAYAPILPLGDMVFSSEVLLFAVICTINMTAIDFYGLPDEEGVDARAVLNLAILLLAGIAMFVYMSTLQREAIFFNEEFYHEQAFYKPFAIALLVGAASFFLLNQASQRISRSAYRVYVDLVVLVPVFVFWVVTVLDRDPRT